MEIYFVSLGGYVFLFLCISCDILLKIDHLTKHPYL